MMGFGWEHKDFAWLVPRLSAARWTWDAKASQQLCNILAAKLAKQTRR
jgi:hypothetical protein